MRSILLAITLLSSLAVVLLSSGNAASQKRGARRSANRAPGNWILANRPLGNFSFNAISPYAYKPSVKRVSRYQLNLEIADGPKYAVSITSPDRASQIDALDLESLVADLSGEGAYAPSTSKVTINASPNITMFDLWRPIELFPSGTELTLPLSLKADVDSPASEVRLILPSKSNSLFDLSIFPDPLLIVASLRSDGQLALNNEVHGTLSDTEPLTKKLRDIFQDRKDQGAFRAGTNEVEKSVTIMMPMSKRKVSDLMAVARAVWLSGSDPISLVMEDPLNTNSTINLIPPSPANTIK